MTLVEQPTITELATQRLQQVGVARAAQARVREGVGGQDDDLTAPTREAEGDGSPVRAVRQHARSRGHARQAGRRADAEGPHAGGRVVRRQHPLLARVLAPPYGVQGRPAARLFPSEGEGFGRGRLGSVPSFA